MSSPKGYIRQYFPKKVDYNKVIEPLSDYEKLTNFVAIGIRMSDDFSVVMVSQHETDKVFETLITKPQSDYFMFILNDLGKKAETFKSPYHHLIDFIEAQGGAIIDLTVTDVKNGMFMGVICANIDGKAIIIEVPVGDIIIYSTLLRRPFNILSKCYDKIKALGSKG